MESEDESLNVRGMLAKVLGAIGVEVLKSSIDHDRAGIR